MDLGTLIIAAGVSLFCVVAATFGHLMFTTMLENAYRKGWRDCRNSGVMTDPEFNSKH